MIQLIWGKNILTSSQRDVIAAFLSPFFGPADGLVGPGACSWSRFSVSSVPDSGENKRLPPCSRCVGSAGTSRIPAHVGAPRSSRRTGDAIYGEKRDRNSERCGVCFGLGLRHVLVFVINVEVIKKKKKKSSRKIPVSCFSCVLIGCVTARAPGLIYGVPSSSFFFFFKLHIWKMTYRDTQRSPL